MRNVTINNHHEKHDLPIFSDLKAGTIENLSNDPDIITGFNKIFGTNIAMQNLFLILTDQEHKKNKIYSCVLDKRL